MNLNTSAFRIRLENGRKRKRTENWNENERILLKRLINEKIDIIENKNTDNTSNFLKSEAWKRIWEKFVVENRCPRTVQNLRDQWKRMKRRKQSQEKFQNGDCAMEEDLDTHLNHTESQSEGLLAQDFSASPETLERNGKCSSDNSESPSTMKRVITQLYHSRKSGVEYKRSLFELNKIVKEQLTNCALEEHSLKMQQMKEEHNLKIKTNTELHAIECENKRLEGQLLMLDIEIRKKQLNNFVL